MVHFLSWIDTDKYIFRPCLVVNVVRYESADALFMQGLSFNMLLSMIFLLDNLVQY